MIIFLLLFCCLIGCGGSAETSGTTTTDQSAITVTTDANYVVWGGSLTATATLLDGSGNPLPNWVVTFTASSGLVAFTPVSATALTNSSGQASIQISPAALDSAGALSITASADITVDGAAKTVTSSPAGISVGGAAVELHSITLGTPTINTYGSSTVSVVVWIDGAPATTPVSVTFTSPCASLDPAKATITTPVSTIGGTATSTYTDNNCNSGTDRIYASVTGAGSRYTDITVTAPSVTSNNINFISASPQIIGTSTASASSLKHSSTVTFQVVDSNGNGVQNILVDFSLLPDNAPGGITLSGSSAYSDKDGYVTVAVNSGTVPTPVWAVATIDGTSIKSQSNTLTITTGLPTQNFFSFSVSTFNIEGLYDDNVTSTLNIIASDRLGNPIPDGTAINFVSNGSDITPSCITANGKCSVTFTSADDRPANGRVAVLAYVLGEESFVDTNANNSYDAGETFTDLGDPFIDNDEDDLHDSVEQYFHYGSGTAYSTGNGVWGMNYVRRNTVIVLSGRAATITPTAVTMGSSCLSYFPLTMHDENNNPMPAGTTVTVSDNTLSYTPYTTGTPTPAKAEASIPVGSPVLSTSIAGGTEVVLKVKADCMAGTPTVPPYGTVELTVQTPKGYKTVRTVTVNH
jgi:hypothetical protein